MAFRDNIYTVLERAGAKDPADRIVLVKEGFSIWAFLFTVLWLLAHRLFIAAALYLVLIIAMVKAVHVMHLNVLVEAALQLGLQLWLGFSARDIQRETLMRHGYVVTDVVVAESELYGARRYFDRHQRA